MPGGVSPLLHTYILYSSVVCAHPSILTSSATELFTLFVSIFFYFQPTLSIFWFIYLGSFYFLKFLIGLTDSRAFRKCFRGDTMHAVSLSISLSFSRSFPLYLKEATNYFSPLTCSLFKCFLCDWLPDCLTGCVTAWRTDRRTVGQGGQ